MFHRYFVHHHSCLRHRVHPFSFSPGLLDAYLTSQNLLCYTTNSDLMHNLQSITTSHQENVDQTNHHHKLIYHNHSHLQVRVSIGRVRSDFGSNHHYFIIF
jgi:hypothetical protein